MNTVTSRYQHEFIILLCTSSVTIMRVCVCGGRGGTRCLISPHLTFFFSSSSIVSKKNYAIIFTFVHLCYLVYNILLCIFFFSKTTTLPTLNISSRVLLGGYYPVFSLYFEWYFSRFSDLHIITLIIGHFRNDNMD